MREIGVTRWVAGVTRTSRTTVRKMDMPFDSGNAHLYSVQASRTTVVSVACYSSFHTRLSLYRVCDPSDPLAVSVRVNCLQLADGQLPHLPSVLTSLNAVHVPTSRPWP